MGEPKFLLSFDLPNYLARERKQINRSLHKLGAKLIQHSLWEHSNLQALKKIASTIKHTGGNAKILQETVQ